MASVPEGCRLFLEPHDDYNHTPDDVPNYNESMYFSVLDPAQQMGGWYRLGNRVNESYAEMTNCWYLPGGRVAFMASRPEIATNEVMNAGGLRFEIEVPMESHRVTYEGKACLLERPLEMIDPGKAFQNNPIVPMRMEIRHQAASLCHGGEKKQADGTPLPIDPEKGFGKAHFDQYMQGEGWIEIGDERFEISGHGARDKTWGPRYWQSIDWYRWIHLRVNDELAIAATVMNDDQGRSVAGLAFTPGAVIEFDEAEITADWDADDYHSSLRFTTRFGEKDYEIEGRVLSLIPLRNRRRMEDGTVLHTRITEALTAYTCNGKPAIGMSEFLDQIVDGRPSGMV